MFPKRLWKKIRLVKGDLILQRRAPSGHISYFFQCFYIAVSTSKCEMKIQQSYENIDEKYCFEDTTNLIQNVLLSCEVKKLVIAQVTITPNTGLYC